MTILFWGSFAAIVYTYLGYPLCLAVLGKVKMRPVAKGSFEAQVSVVIAVFNEGGNILSRLENLLSQDYPADKVEIIVVSDGSTDRTVELVRTRESMNIKLIELAQKQGKAAALNAGVAHACGELVVFCDARQSFQRDALRQLASNFTDPSVGCVSGELILLQRSSSGAGAGIQVEMGAYWKYEKWIRKAESACGSCIGATGAIFAIRRALYRDLPHGLLLDDVMTPMRIVMQGYRAIFDVSALAHDVVSQEVSQEWTRKVRTLAGNWQLASLEPGLMAPWLNPCCWRFVSHKLLRLIVPFALLSLAVSGALLDGAIYQTATALQLVFYGAAGLAWIFPPARSIRLLNLCFFFVIMNAMALAGFWRWATGQCAGAWQPAYAKGGE